MPNRLIYLARHGETDWNAARRWQGQTDVALNAAGRAQALAIAGALRGVAVAGIVASDLARASETARAVAEALGVPLAYVDPALRERSFGCFEGLTREECEERHAEAWRLWVTERRPPPDAEDTARVAARMTTALAEVAERVAHEGAAAIVVAHGGAIRAFVHAATGTLPPPVANGEVCHIRWDGRDFAVLGRSQPLPH